MSIDCDLWVLWTYQLRLSELYFEYLSKHINCLPTKFAFLLLTESEKHSNEIYNDIEISYSFILETKHGKETASRRKQQYKWLPNTKQLFEHVTAGGRDQSIFIFAVASSCDRVRRRRRVVCESGVGGGAAVNTGLITPARRQSEPARPTTLPHFSTTPPHLQYMSYG